jgi:hypothetical protein
MARISKLNKWWKFYTDETNNATFLKGSASAKAAGYKAKTENAFYSIGSQNLRKLKNKLSVWMDEVGMSEESMHLKFLELKNAKETKFIKIKGYVDPKDLLHPSITVIATSGLVVQKEGEEDSFSAGDTLIMIETEALGIQRQILDMGYKIRGTYKPEELKLSGEVKGIGIEFVKSKNEGKE